MHDSTGATSVHAAGSENSCPFSSCNAIAERSVRTGPAEWTGQMLIAGEQHLRAILADYINHYNTGCSHQGIGMGLRAPDVTAFLIPATQIQRRTRLAGLINEYSQAA
jgi:putative transposase